MTPFMELTDVSRCYGSGDTTVWALRSVSLRIIPGDFVSIVGPSGSGKSTLLGLLGCLDVPTSGTILVEGEDVTAVADATRTRVRGRSIGFVFQQFHLIPHLDALGNVGTALLYRGLRPAEVKEKSMAALARVGLAHRHDHRSVQLSGGEQQRVAIARALVTEPRILLADEPTGALDSNNAAMVIDILSGLRDESRAVVIVTHDLDIANSAARKISMRDGQVVNDEVLVP